MLHPHVPPAGRDRLVENVVRARSAEQRAIAGAKAGDRSGIERNLARRLEGGARPGPDRALGHGIEGAGLLEGVAEKVEPERVFRPRRKDVENAPPDGELAGFHHRLGAAEPMTNEKRDHVLGRHPRARIERESHPGEDRARRNALQRRRHGGQHHPGH